jgi:hypothetical protein
MHDTCATTCFFVANKKETFTDVVSLKETSSGAIFLKKNLRLSKSSRRVVADRKKNYPEHNITFYLRNKENKHQAIYMYL